nr:helicase 2 [Menippe mercenaria nudivirus]
MDISKCKVTNMEMLCELSIQSKHHLQHNVKNADQIIKRVKTEYKHYFDKVWVNNPIQTQIILNSLNDDQKNAFLKVFDNLQKPNGSITTIDAGPGTGKTFLTACILMTYKLSAVYMVYTNRLSECMNELYFNGVSVTCCKFLMNFLSLTYGHVKYMWYLKDKTLIEKCQEIEIIAKEHKPFHQVYVLDENSVVSPLFVYFLVCLKKFHNIHLIFIGDRYQQIPINATRHHMEPNFSLLRVVSDTMVELSINVRQNKDVKFVAVLKRFVKEFSDNNLHMNFAIKYFFYDQLKPKFHAKEDFEATFFAQHHIVLKKRVDRYEQYLKDNKINYTKAYLHVKVGKSRSNLEPIREIDEITKFKPYIILVLGKTYTYAPNKSTCLTVVLKEIRGVWVKIYCIEKDRNMWIKKVPLNIYFSSDQLIAQITELRYTCAYQFPLKENINTYHAAQGLTIASSKIELDIDCNSVNSFYVGITRIKNSDQLIKIHSNDLMSLAYTRYKNDDYYYKIVNYTKPIQEISFTLCNNVNVFEKTKVTNYKIPRQKYLLMKNKNSDTDLIQYIKKHLGVNNSFT